MAYCLQQVRYIIWSERICISLWLCVPSFEDKYQIKVENSKEMVNIMYKRRLTSWYDKINHMSTTLTI